MTVHWLRRVFGAALLVVSLSVMFGCDDDSTAAPSSSCTMGPYTFDSNPNVNRCRARNGQFAPNVCCGR